MPPPIPGTARYRTFESIQRQLKGLLPYRRASTVHTCLLLIAFSMMPPIALDFWSILFCERETINAHIKQRNGPQSRLHGASRCSFWYTKSMRAAHGGVRATLAIRNRNVCPYWRCTTCHHTTTPCILTVAGVAQNVAFAFSDESFEHTNTSHVPSAHSRQ